MELLLLCHMCCGELQPNLIPNFMHFHPFICHLYLCVMDSVVLDHVYFSFVRNSINVLICSVIVHVL